MIDQLITIENIIKTWGSRSLLEASKTQKKKKKKKKTDNSET
jgi:hypothetical protein